MIYVIFPAWNEERTIRATLLALWRAMPGRESEYRAVLVNDGSTDRTVAEAEAAVRESGGALPLTVIGHETNRGLGAGLCTGLTWCLNHAADGDVVVTLDADNTHPPATIPALVEKLDEGYDIVIASRYRAASVVRGVPGHRLMLSDSARVLFRVLYPIPGVRDYTCCFRAFRVALLRRARDLYGEALCTATGFEAVMDLLLRLAALHPRVAEIGFTLDYGDRVGFSKMRVAKTARSTVGLLLRRRWERMTVRRRRVPAPNRAGTQLRGGAVKL
jgi:dolichol-phosphate mannosyltransferase